MRRSANMIFLSNNGCGVDSSVCVDWRRANLKPLTTGTHQTSADGSVKPKSTPFTSLTFISSCLLHAALIWLQAQAQAARLRISNDTRKKKSALTIPTIYQHHDSVHSGMSFHAAQDLLVTVAVAVPVHPKAQSYIHKIRYVWTTEPEVQLQPNYAERSFKASQDICQIKCSAVATFNIKALPAKNPRYWLSTGPVSGIAGSRRQNQNCRNGAS